MAKNDYQARQRAAKQAFLNIGVECGRQQATDMFITVLADFEIMGNKKLRPEEQEKVLRETEKRLRYFFEAWEKSQEADKYQEELDTLLRDAVPPERFDPFEKRYPYMYQFDYEKGRFK